MPAVISPNALPGVTKQSRLLRIDLHCHSEASTAAGEGLVLAIGCPESYSAPAEVYVLPGRRSGHVRSPRRGCLRMRRASYSAGSAVSCGA